MDASEILPMFETCQTHGEYKVSTIDAAGVVRYFSGCPWCSKAAELERIIGRAAIPPRFVDKTLDDFETPNPRQVAVLALAQNYLKDFPAALKSGRSMMFCGAPGTGKTHIAAGILNALVRDGYRGLYATVITAVRRVKDTWNRSSPRTERDAIFDFVIPELLVLDEVGVQFGSEAERLILFEIINGRYEQLRPTILMSNLDLKGVEANLGERAVDRLRENGGRVVIFDWQSHRKEPA